MTIEETAQVMDLLHSAYPRWGKDKPDPEKELLLWASMFDEEPLPLVAAAVKALIATKTDDFPPVPGAVKAYIRKLKNPHEMTEAYDSRKEFDKLPKLIKRLVGEPSQLKEWAMVDTDTLQTVVASNFQRSYRARAESEREYQAIPASVRAIAGKIAGNFALENGND
jgi:hypothetical protein